MWTDPSKLEHLVHHKLLPNRSQPWTHSDHREAWACEGAGTIARRRGADSDYFDGVGLHLVHEDRGKRQDHGEVLRQAQKPRQRNAWLTGRLPRKSSTCRCCARCRLSRTRTLLTTIFVSTQNSNVHRYKPTTATRGRLGGRLGEWLALSDMLVLERPAKDALEFRAHR